MKKALFYRNAKNISEYNKVILNYREYADCLDFYIVKKILLTDEQFNSFINDFKSEQKFIENHKNLMTMDNNDAVSCLFVYCKKINYGILVYSAGYKYARYIAKYKT